jgi:UDP-N-acetylmuramyl pentapeptide phosphotransferase/UDP-N-acetylglucosamine-1-phosphate transferase
VGTALHSLIYAGTVAASGVAAWLGTAALIPWLRRAAVLDRPNERSSHAVPMPRGGGIAVVAAILAAWTVLTAIGALPPRLLTIPAGALLLAIVSWRDDRGGLSPGIRLLAQFAAIGVGLTAMPPGDLVVQGWLPTVLDGAAAALVWIWFVNLFNFMDGIDGLAGSEAAAIGGGLTLTAGFGVAADPGLAVAAAAVATASLGFLRWNRAPARVFLGDVGSVPLGYLLGFLLLDAAARGHPWLALILPLYFLADATITLLRRLLRGERVWQAHCEHFYQQAVRCGLGHAEVVRRVIAADLALIGCGWIAECWSPAAGLALAASLVALLLVSLAGLPRRGRHPIPRATPRIEEPPR